MNGGFDVPARAVFAADDTFVSRDGVNGRREVTTGKFSLTEMAGGHTYWPVMDVGREIDRNIDRLDRAPFTTGTLPERECQRGGTNPPNGLSARNGKTQGARLPGSRHTPASRSGDDADGALSCPGRVAEVGRYSRRRVGGSGHTPCHERRVQDIDGLECGPFALKGFAERGCQRVPTKPHPGPSGTSHTKRQDQCPRGGQFPIPDRVLVWRRRRRSPAVFRGWPPHILSSGHRESPVVGLGCGQPVRLWTTTRLSGGIVGGLG